jgi:hypothetical protein
MRRRSIIHVLWAALFCGLPAGLLECGSSHESEPLSCGDLVLQASTERYRAVRSASRACLVDSDCILEHFSLSCVDDCGSRALMTNAAVPGVEALLQAAEDRYCLPFESKGCAVAPPPCDPALDGVTPICRVGVCDVVEPDAGMPLDSGAARDSGAALDAG